MSDPVRRDLSALVHLWAGPTTAAVALLAMRLRGYHSTQQCLAVLGGCLLMFVMRYRGLRDGVFSAALGVLLWVPLGAYLYLLGEVVVTSTGRAPEASDAAYLALLRNIPVLLLTVLGTVCLAALGVDILLRAAHPRRGAWITRWSEVSSMFSWLVAFWFALLSVALTPPLFLVVGFAAFTGQSGLAWFFALTSTGMVVYVLGAVFAIRALTRGEWQRFRLAVANARQTTGDMSRA